MKNQVKYDLYLVTDKELSLGRKIEDIVYLAVKGGADIVQYRDKNCSDEEFITVANKIKSVISQFNKSLIINDRIHLIDYIDYDGIHIGQSDMPYIEARKMIGVDKILGLSIENRRQALEAKNYDLDYVAASPVFLTNTKTDTAEALGLSGVRELKEIFRTIPLVGIGGINITNIADIIKYGADGVAIVSAICSADNPETAAQLLKNEINKAKNEVI
jgi:thiamine-phosphate pyrophosphorylase